ncbi:kinase interacting family protein [Striga asiatica]|uniref:Kinase interacting family protein n=1 Tax=Striga asiatica TaxID=4170 RepID=A0A5A7QW47_STRAF|nr:kinase interacting family protein [Striga asiatica]
MAVKSEVDDAQVSDMREHLSQQHIQHAKLMADADWGSYEGGRSAERRKLLYLKGERLFIRQLCFSLEHYCTVPRASAGSQGGTYETCYVGLSCVTDDRRRPKKAEMDFPDRNSRGWPRSLSMARPNPEKNDPTTFPMDE